MLLTVIVCDNVPYFNEKFPCWSKTHIFLIIPCSISSLILLFLSYIFISLSFNNTDKFSSSVSKYLIINGSCIMMICKFITLLFLEICCVIDIFNVCIASFLCTSLICSYSFFIERKYQNSKYNPIIVVKFILNVIYCWGCILLFFGNFIKQSSFKGLLQIFIISSFLFVFMILYLDNNNFNAIMIDEKKDIDIYNNLRLFINAIEIKKNDRESIMNILSYSYYKTNLYQVKKIKNIENLSKIINQSKESIENNKEIDFILYQHIDDLYKDALNVFKSSPILLVNYAVFQMEKLHKYQKCYKTLQKSLELHNLSYSEEFFIYRIKRNLEEKGIEMGVEQTHISFAFQTKEILSQIQTISSYYSQFWTLLLNKSESMDINQLKDLGGKISEMRELVKEKYRYLVNNGLITKKINTLYGNFVEEVLNDKKDIQNILNTDFENDDKFKESFFDIHCLTSKSDYQFIIANGFGESFGIIKKISLEICELLGYSNLDLLEKNIKLILPDFIREKHERMLKVKVQNMTSKNNYLTNLRELFVLFRNSAKFLVPAFIDTGIIYDENNRSILFLKLTEKLDKNDENLRNKCFILINNKLCIQNFTPNCLNILDLESHIINSNVEITQFINEFNDEVLRTLSNFEDNEIIEPLQLKIKILTNKFVDNSNKIITWKNNKKFECTVQPLVILDEVVGYWLELQSIDLLIDYYSKNSTNSNNTNSNRNLYLKKSSSAKKNSEKKSRKSSINLLNENENFKIPYSFIPTSEEEIDFDVEGKSFVLKNKFDLKDDDQYLSIQKFFDKQYKDDIKLDKEVIEEEASYLTSSSEESEGSDYEDDEEYEEEVSSSNIDNTKNNNILNKSIYKDDNTNYDNYYKIYSKIKFSIYNYNTHTFNEVNNYNFEYKVEEIMNGERNTTKRTSLTKANINSEEAINKYQLIGNRKINNYNSLLNIDDFGKSNTVKKIISPHFINKSIIYLLFYFILSLIVLTVVPYIIFEQIIKSIQTIYKVSSYVHCQCSISENVILTCYYLSQYIFLKNPRYSPQYIENKTEYSEFLYKEIKKIYNETQQQLEVFIYEKPSVSKKSQEIIDNYMFNLNTYWYINNYAYEFELHEILMTPAVQIYFYSSLMFIDLEESNQHFLVTESQFVTSNYQIIADGIAILNQYYIDEITLIAKNKKLFLWIIFILYLICEAIITYFCILAKIKIIREKEKYLNIFYKIDMELIHIMNTRCQKYAKLQIDQNSLTQKQEFFNDDSSDNENATLISNKENESNFSYSNNKITNIKHENIFKNKFFQKQISLTAIVNLILITLIVFYIINAIISYKKFINSARINFLSLEQERYFIKSINYMSNKLINSGYYLYLRNLTYSLETILAYFQNNFNEIRNLELYIYENISKYGLPENTSNIIINNFTSDLCYYFDHLHNLSNMTCDEIANNIAYYGLMPIYGYYIKIIIEIAFEYYKKILTAFNKGYIYFDFAYGTTFYHELYPPNVDLVEYNELNCFLLFNDFRYGNINLLIINILIPFYQSLMGTLFKNFEDYFQYMYDINSIGNTLFICFVLVYYFLKIFPIIYRENKDINKTRTILSVIPKNVIYEIIKNENIKKEKENEK